MPRNRESGFALLYVFFFVIMLAGMVVAYLFMNSQNSASFGNKYTEAQVFYAAEAAQARAVQYLQNNWGGIWNPANGIQPGVWNRGLSVFPAAGEETGTLNMKTAISYNFIVDNWNLAYNTTPPFAGTLAQNSTGTDLQPAQRVLDGDVMTMWESQDDPDITNVVLTIQFPVNSNYTINEIRIRRQGGAGRPTAYTWCTSTDGLIYTPPIAFTTDGAGNEWCDFFNTPARDVNYLQMTITSASGNSGVRIGEIEIPWIRIRSRCQINKPGGTSFTEKYIRSCVLTNSRAAGATITKIIPSALPNTNITSIWDEISQDTYSNPALF